MKGNMLVNFIQAYGASVKPVIENVKVCPESKNLLISIFLKISQRAQIFDHGHGSKVFRWKWNSFNWKLKMMDVWIAEIKVSQMDKLKK